MEFKDNKNSYELVSEQGLRVTIIVSNTGLAPIYVTVSTESPYCFGDNSTTTDRIGIDREVEVSFVFDFGREIGLDEEIKLNFTGSIAGAGAANDEHLQATVRSGVILSAEIVLFEYTGETEEDEEIYFKVEVLNNGNAPATILVKVFDGKDEVENISKIIQVNETEKFDILWVAEEGKHTFTAKAYILLGYVDNDPQKAPKLLLVDESEKSLVLDVESGGVFSEDNISTIVIVAVVVGVLVILIILYLKRDKIKKAFKGKK